MRNSSTWGTAQKWRAALKWFLAGVIALCLGLSLSLSAAIAKPPLGYKTLTKKASFDDVEFELQNAIIDRGLKVDYIGHVGAMLSRTSKTVGSVIKSGSKSPYLKAKYYQFCSAKLTHEVVRANPLNISVCPYVVFLFELRTSPGVVHVGYRIPFAGPSEVTQKAVAKVEALLASVIKDALG